MDATADTFIKFDYTETKQLLTTFITLISATLVLSITFSEKVIGFNNATRLARRLLLASWAFLIAALILSGTGLVFIACAAGKILYKGLPFLNFDFGTLAITAWSCGLAAGASYVIGLITMAAAAGLEIERRK